MKKTAQVMQLDATLAMHYKLHESVPQWELGYLYGVLKEILVGVGYNHTHRCPRSGALSVHLGNPYTIDGRVLAGVPCAVVTIDPHLAYIRSTNFHYQDDPPYTFCTTVLELLDHLEVSAARYRKLTLRAAREQELRLYEHDETNAWSYCDNCLYCSPCHAYCGLGLPRVAGCRQRQPLYCITRYPPLEGEE